MRHGRQNELDRTCHMCHVTRMARSRGERRRSRKKALVSRRDWVEKGVRLSSATVTLFEGPADDWLLVLHGRRTGSGLLTRPKRRAKTH